MGRDRSSFSTHITPSRPVPGPLHGSRRRSRHTDPVLIKCVREEQNTLSPRSERETESQIKFYLLLLRCYQTLKGRRTLWGLLTVHLIDQGIVDPVCILFLVW